jgi:hypothetical protein
VRFARGTTDLRLADCFSPKRADCLETARKLLGIQQDDSPDSEPESIPSDPDRAADEERSEPDPRAPRCPRCGRVMKKVEGQQRPSWRITINGKYRPSWYNS